ncbi:MAG: PQ-loop domain-containing transporter [Bdellovibrionales bacterium]
MEHTNSLVQIFSWAAIFLLSISYWFQIWKIHVHKEVRDLSMAYHVLLALGFGMLTYRAYIEGSTIFIVKQVMTTVPVLIIIGQIIVHKGERWRDDDEAFCSECKKEFEPTWNNCAYCGLGRVESKPANLLKRAKIV